MNYQETLDYLFTRLPMFSRIGAAAFKKDLTNTIRLCEALGNPQQRFKTIHVAGTNGKGSTSHMLAAILQTAGYKTGLYTSPHLKDFRERIKVNGEVCCEAFVTQFTQRIQPLIETIEPSFFEITVAMAFDYFANQQVDVAVIEVGLGGRLDSTNIINPELSVITNIGWDHMNMLGDTLPLIAAEKAGIIKPRVPVVIGETVPETKPVFEQKAAGDEALGIAPSPVFFAETARYVTDWKYEQHKLVVEVADNRHNEHLVYQLDLPGIYQVKNLLTVLETVTQLQLKGWRIDQHMIHLALQQVKKITGLHGRWELIHHDPVVVLDVAHNIDGIRLIREQLELSTYKQLHIVIGMVKDKEVDKVLALLPSYAQYYFTKAQIPRALDEKQLKEMAAKHQLRGHAFEVRKAMENASKEDMVLVCGSVFLVGEVK